MPGSNPFRVRNLGNPAAPLSTNPGTLAPVPSKPLSTPPIAPNGYPRKSSIPLEREVADSSSSDEETNPFNLRVSASESEDKINAHQSPAPLEDDRQRDYSGSAPHLAPSTDGSPISPDHNMPSATGADSFYTGRHARSSIELDASPLGRARDKKPPPPPRSHHGRRIGSIATAESSQTARSRSTNRLSIPGSPGNLTLGTSHPSSVSLSSADYFSVTVATGSTDSLQRSQSQHKRPPTPPLSRRHSQMRRSKSTQSKITSRLNMSYDSESNDGSLPPSPGPSSRVENKRLSMPPPSSGDFQATAPLGNISLNLSPPTNSRPSSLKAGRRTSSYGSVSGPPPPPPPRRTRDSIARSSDVMGLKENQSPAPVPVPVPAPAPQPSNALDILADLTKLQKEVDDLRGHYENR
ncbi:hypothetical protein CBS147332_8817 [Penicillium roqueforti]|nr:hypothetical protein CBS147332_8817 [Penicillium roqueforti]KAI3096631.1 hypothetical protein CBS147331_9162 [Penicillium roqueforti]